MKAHVVEEPELEFRSGCYHVDPRVGLATYGPADLDAPSRPHKITIGVVGPPDQVEGVRAWLKRCRDPITRKESKPGQENLFIDFPGCRPDTAFQSEVVFDDALVREIPERESRRLANSNPATTVSRWVDLYTERVQSLSETGKCPVIVCCRPDELDDQEDEPVQEQGATPEIEDPEVDDGSDPDLTRASTQDFHDLLKARTLGLDPPIQLIRRSTWLGKLPKGPRHELQDEATRAWNLHVALYYKAGGTPWRLPRRSTDLQTCFVGVSFYKTPDGSQLHTSVAQVFNERGDGVVVRGGTAAISKSDRTPHLAEDDSRRLLDDALRVYKTVHGNLPARVAIHKSSSFSSGEVTGFQRATDDREIDRLELLWIQTGAPRLFRSGELPPLRGTTLELEPGAAIVYTRGSVEFFRTYPGLYVPRPLLVRAGNSGVDMRAAAVDILGLSKMNWNNAQLDERDPLTLRTAKRVGSILKHVKTTDTVATRYAKYM